MTGRRTPGRSAWRLLPSLLALVAAGAVSAEPMHYSVQAALGSTYDSNLYRLSPVEKKTIGQAFQSLDDAFVVPQAAVDVHVPFSLQDFEFRAAIAGRYHAENTSIDSREYALLARLSGTVAQICQATVLAEQTRRFGTLDDLDEPGSNITRQRHADFDGSCLVMPRLSIAATADYRNRQSPGRVQSRADLEETEATTRITYGEPDTVQAFVGASYRYREQPNFLSFVIERTQARATIWAGGGGAFWTVSPNLKLSGAAYWTSLEERSHRRDENGFISADASADWEFSVKTSVRLYAVRELAVAPNVGSIAYPQWAVGGRVTWAATPKLNSAFSIERRHRDILRDRQPVLTDPFTRRERDTTIIAGWNLDYAVSDPLHVRIGADYRRRVGNFEDIRVTAATVSVAMVYHFVGVPFDTGL